MLMLMPRPVSNIQNYRPLTVLTCMLGVYTKVLNKRLIEVVERHRLLGEVQNGFRKDRSGADSGFVLNTVLWKSMAKKRKVHVSFLDLTKAYDSVCRETLWRRLARMGFGGEFLRTLQSMYQSDYVTCQANGVTTRPVYLGRGLRQGCSLSPLLFALYVADMGHELSCTDYGVKLYRVTVSALFFAVSIPLSPWPPLPPCLADLPSNTDYPNYSPLSLSPYMP